ncbi:alpha-L-fucosidase C-terminal domain-containing protein [Paludisphaera mucosa]|uniref:Alpha-L-fucosidase C-terminal domain-containing protein n=1 Tax=Paludisphaera mucosa TaxID=3030827 RepID=A0ABT6FF57_9BACT|nr:alpha-L-fucosidase C-terminal domain-containing protein [Paludisphaera mucosa]MDG3006167.1 alpha-L-fucosidase C-terminal domain-containing protein [Paludisphaera mucosa]
MAEWIAVNGEAIYGTRPWLVHGEGPVRARGGNFKEDFAYTARDLRFTSKGDGVLYVFALDWPADHRIHVRSLGKFPGVVGRIADVALLGSRASLKWTHDADGLTVTLPDEKPCDHALALKITGESLSGFKPELAAPIIALVRPDAAGLIELKADEAELHGTQIQVEDKGGRPSVGFWDRPSESVSWRVGADRGGKYRISASCATVHQAAVLAVDADGKVVELHPVRTAGWDQFAETEAVEIELPPGGERTVKAGPRDAASWKAVNLRWIRLIPASP